LYVGYAMCVIAFAYKTAALGPLFLISNRDEYYARASTPLGRWPEPHQEVLGGRDLQSGGSWLALDNRGRFAAVTNIRDGLRRQGERSRGLLVSDFVTGDADALAFAEQLRQQRQRYAPFNLLFGQVDDLYHFHSVTGTLARVTPGIHTLANATLDTPWYKTKKLAAALAECQRLPREDEALEWLADASPAPPGQLPNTGVGLALEKMLSPVFIKGRDYGTRSSIVLSASARGDVQYVERSFSMSGRETSRLRHTLRIGPPIRKPS
jgi:uncharacterized protein with NRDE domain